MNGECLFFFCEKINYILLSRTVAETNKIMLTRTIKLVNHSTFLLVGIVDKYTRKSHKLDYITIILNVAIS